MKCRELQGSVESKNEGLVSKCFREDVDLSCDLKERICPEEAGQGVGAARARRWEVVWHIQIHKGATLCLEQGGQRGEGWKPRQKISRQGSDVQGLKEIEICSERRAFQRV